MKHESRLDNGMYLSARRVDFGGESTEICPDCYELLEDCICDIVPEDDDDEDCAV